MLVSPAFCGVRVGIVVYTVKRMYLSVRYVGKRIVFLWVIGFFQVSCDNVVVTSARITRGLVVNLTAIGIRYELICALSLHFYRNNFAVDLVERVCKGEVIALRSRDAAAHLPKQIVILAVIIGGLCSPGVVPSGGLRLRSVFFHTGDLCLCVYIHVGGIALFNMLFSVAVNDQFCLEFRTGIAICGRSAVRIVVHIIISTFRRTVTDVKIAVLCCRARQTVEHDDFFRSVLKRIDPVDEYVVISQIRIVVNRQRYIEIIRGIPALIL